VDDPGGRIRGGGRTGGLGRAIGSMGRDASKLVISVMCVFGTGGFRNRFDTWSGFDSVMVRVRSRNSQGQVCDMVRVRFRNG